MSANIVYLLSGVCLIVSIVSYLIFHKTWLSFLFFGACFAILSVQQAATYKDAVSTGLFAVVAIIWFVRAART
jgi:hypothetical protein